MEDGCVAVLVDAKEEYTKQLNNILKPCIYQGIKSIFLDAKNICENENTPDNVLMTFQDLLSRIPKWSQEIITKEYERIVEESKCDWIEDLLKVIYLAHIKVLTIVHSAQNNKKISLKVPTGSHFMHICYIETAREFWKNPYLFSDRVSKFEYQNNMRTCENIINDCICETIRKQLPVRHILKEYLGDFENDGEATDDEEDIKKPISTKYMKRLESMVKRELQNEDSVKNIIDQDDIRRIIKEELTNMNTVKENKEEKEEIVSNVVDKIKEEVDNESNTDETPVEETPVEETPVEETTSNVAVTDVVPVLEVVNNSNVAVEEQSTLVEEVPDLEIEDLDEVSMETIVNTTEEPATTTEEPAITTEEPTTTTEEPTTTTEEPTTTTEEPTTTTEESTTTTEEPATTTEEPPSFDNTNNDPVIIPITTPDVTTESVDTVPELRIDQIDNIDLDLNELNDIDSDNQENISSSPLNDIESLDDIGLEEVDTSAPVNDEVVKLNNNEFSFFS
jgi:hypothetical protein